MGRITRFEDLIAWQKARLVTAVVYRVCRREPFRRDFALSDQARRAAISIMSNLAEGFERGGRREFHQFLSTAKASCAELRSCLYVAFDAGYLSQEEVASLMGQATEVARIVGGLRAAVAYQVDRGRAVDKRRR